MTPKQFAEELEQHFRRRPFIPFRVELVHGESLVVHRPDAMIHDGKFRKAGALDYRGMPYSFEPDTVLAFTLVPDYTLPADAPPQPVRCR